MVTILGSTVKIEAGSVLVAIVGFVFILLLTGLLVLHHLLHPESLAEKQDIHFTVRNLKRFLIKESSGLKSFGKLSGQLSRWLEDGFTEYKVNGVTKKGININNYSNDSVSWLKELDSTEFCDNDRHMFDVKKLITHWDLFPVEHVRACMDVEETTDMMNVLNHQKKTSEYMSRIKQMLIGFEWSGRTQDLLDKRTLSPIIAKVTRVHGSPTFPKALNFSEVRDLKKSKDWRERLMNICVLCEKPWKELKNDDLAIVSSASSDLLVFSVKVLVIPIALGLSVG